MLYPLIWTAVNSLKGSNVEILDRPFRLPGQIHPENYIKAVREGRMGEYFINSLWVTGLSAVIVVMGGVWSGYALSKPAFPGGRYWKALLFLGMILPVQSYLIPLVDLLQWIGIHDSLWALILPYAAQSLPVSMLLLSAYFQSIPVELEEACRMDGVGSLRFYLTILIPVARPAIATVAVLSCLNTWNEFLMALLFIANPDFKTLPVGMIAFEQSHNTNYPELLAGLCLIAVPTLIAYGLFNRQVVRGVAEGVLK
jgi:raffinose/stachyose/melibiose transport system permease protein